MMRTGRPQVGGKIVGINLPYSLCKGLEWLIDIGAFNSKLAATRKALRDLLRSYGFYDAQKREALLLVTQKPQ